MPPIRSTRPITPRFAATRPAGDAGTGSAIHVANLPDGAAVTIDGSRVLASSRPNPDGAAVFATLAGTRRIDVTPATGPAKTATVAAPAADSVRVDFATMESVTAPAVTLLDRGRGDSILVGPDGTVTAPLSTVSIIGMPPGGATFIDDAPIDFNASVPLSRYDGGSLVWVVPAAPGLRRVRVDPPAGRGPSRSGSIEVREGVTVHLPYADMVPIPTGGVATDPPVTSPPPPPPPPVETPAPTLRIVGMPHEGAVWIDDVRTDDGLSSWADATYTTWVVPASAGPHKVRIVPRTGNPRTGEASAPGSVMFASLTEERPAAVDQPPPPPVQEPVKEEERPPTRPERQKEPDMPPPSETSPATGTPIPAGSGRVVIRTLLDDAEAMVQSLDGARSAPDAVRSAGALTITAPAGDYQLVVWQGALSRTNVRQTRVTVVAGQTVTYSYTGAALTRDGAAPAPIPADGSGITVTPVSSEQRPQTALERFASSMLGLAREGASRNALLLLNRRPR